MMCPALTVSRMYREAIVILSHDVLTLYRYDERPTRRRGYGRPICDPCTIGRIRERGGCPLPYAEES